jgi:hypothetical protein
MEKPEPGNADSYKHFYDDAASIDHTQNAFRCLAETWTKDMCVCFTDAGYVGSRSSSMSRNDLLCILFGCKLPLVLRQGKQSTYRIKDAVYVDGIMGGKFLEDEAQCAVTEFVIS